MSEILEYRSLLLDGLWLTILTFVLGFLLAVVVAFVLGLAGLSEHRAVRWLVTIWVEFWRGTSVLVQMFVLFYVFPPLFGLNLSAVTCAVVALGLNEGAYASEIVRGTIATRAKGQNEAGIALGMSKYLRMRRVLIPQSIPAMLPPFGNVAVDTLKNTSLASLILVNELTFQAQQVWTPTGKTIEVFSALLVAYFILAVIVAAIFWVLERRFDLARTSGDRVSASQFLRSAGGG